MTTQPGRQTDRESRSRTDEDRYQHLWLIRPDGTGLRRLARNYSPVDNPSWSPDGNWIAIDDGNEINLVSAAGMVRDIPDPRRGLDVDPAWSPDGRSIAFIHYSSARATVGDLWIMDAAGKNRRLVVREVERLRHEPQRNTADLRAAHARD